MCFGYKGRLIIPHRNNMVGIAGIPVGLLTTPARVFKLFLSAADRVAEVSVTPGKPAELFALTVEDICSIEDDRVSF